MTDLDPRLLQLLKQYKDTIAALESRVIEMEKRPPPKDGDPGRPGDDGTSVSIDDVTKAVLDELGVKRDSLRIEITQAVLAAIPKPVDGAPGKDADISITDVAAIVLAKIPKPKNGRDAPTLEQIIAAVAPKIPRGQPGPKGEKGEKGEQGAKGDSVNDVQLRDNRLFVSIDGREKEVGSIKVPTHVINRGGGGGANALNVIGTKSFDNVVIVKNITQLTDHALDSTKSYFLDGSFTTDKTITIPSGGIIIQGLDALISSLTYTGSGTMFQSPVGGCGTVTFDKITLSNTTVGSKMFDLTGATGTEFVTLRTSLILNSQSMGELTGFSGYLSLTSARVGGKPELTLSGSWNSLRIEPLFANTLDADFTGSLLKEGTTLSIAGRGIIVPAVDLPVSGSVCDFSNTVFQEEASFLVRFGRITRLGVITENGSVFPNTDEKQLTSLWRANVGLVSTYPGGTLAITAETATTFTGIGVATDMLGTWTSSQLQHFSQDSNNRLMHDGDAIVGYVVEFTGSIGGTAGDILTLTTVKWDASASGFVPVDTQTREILNLPGGADQAYFSLKSFAELQNGDYVKVQLTNTTSTNAATAINSAKLLVSER